VLLLAWRLILLPTRLSSRGIDMVVHVDADAPGDDRSNTRITPPRINPLAHRIQPCLPEQHRTAGTHRSRQEISS
jgi:hypothetical protein